MSAAYSLDAITLVGRMKSWVPFGTCLEPQAISTWLSSAQQETCLCRPLSEHTKGPRVASARPKTRTARQRAGVRSVVVPVLMVASCLAIIVAASGFYLVAGYKSERVTRGVSVRNIDLSGMTAEEARAALRPTLDQLTSGPIALTHGEDTWEVTRGDLGLVIDVDGTIAAAMAVGHSGGVIDAWRTRRAAASDGVQVPVATIIREPVLVGALGRLAGDLQREAEPARVDDRATGMISVRRDVVGRVLDTAATRELASVRG